MSSQNKKVSSQMLRSKSFLDFFHIGDEVAIIRHKHGWENGNKSGRITFLTSYYATVEDFDGDKYTIEHVRDIKHG